MVCYCFPFYAFQLKIPLDTIGSDDFLGIVHLNVAQLLNGRSKFQKRILLQTNKLFGIPQGDIHIKLKTTSHLPLMSPYRFNSRKQNMFDFECTFTPLV